MIYQAVPADEPLTQGNIFDGCPIYRDVPGDNPDRQPARVIVLTQA